MGVFYGISFFIVTLLTILKLIQIGTLKSYLKDAEADHNSPLINKYKQEIKRCYKWVFAYGFLYFLSGFIITVIANVLY